MSKRGMRSASTWKVTWAYLQLTKISKVLENIRKIDEH